MKKRYKILIAILCVMAFMTVGTTVAYFTQTNAKNNNIKTGQIDIKVHETLEGDGKKAVTAELVGEHVKCWVRMYVGIPKGKNGTELFTKSKIGDDWSYNEKDGYYYYSKPVEPGVKVINPYLFDSITPSTTEIAKADLPANIDIIVYAEAIQYNEGDEEGNEEGNEGCVKAFEKFKSQNNTTN